MNLPNFLTSLRMILAPVIGYRLMAEGEKDFLTFSLFIFASLTDFFDGYVAQKINAKSAFGAMLDPLADKMLISLVMLFLVAHQTIAGIHVWACAIMFSRDLIVLSLRSSWGAERLPVIPLAKGKTALQCLALSCFLCPSFFLGGWEVDFFSLPFFGFLFLWISAFFSVVTGIAYMRKALNLAQKNPSSRFRL